MHSDSRMMSFHKYNKTMFSRLSSRLDTTERVFEEILGPLEEIIQGIEDKGSTVSHREHRCRSTSPWGGQLPDRGSDGGDTV